MNLQEMATIMHHKLPIIVYVYNNNGYLSIRQTFDLGFQGNKMGCDPESGLSFPELSDLAKAYDFQFLKFENNTEAKERIEESLQYGSPVIVEIMVDPNQEQMPKAINRRDENGKTIPTSLEDSYPFLPDDEVKKRICQSSKHLIAALFPDPNLGLE